MTLNKGDDPVSEMFESIAGADQETIHSLIYDYLIHNCFGDTANSFAISCGVQKEAPAKPDSMDIDSSEAIEIFDVDCDQMDLDGQPSINSKTNLKYIAVKTLPARKKLRDLILSGLIVEAIEYCEQIFPNLINNTNTEKIQDVLFTLKCQQFIECIKKGAPEALEFAQKGILLLLLKNLESLHRLIQLMQKLSKIY